MVYHRRFFVFNINALLGFLSTWERVWLFYSAEKVSAMPLSDSPAKAGQRYTGSVRASGDAST